MREPFRRTWAEIDLDAIEHNARQIKALLDPGCKMMAVVKADAYGHGDRQTAAVLKAAGADAFAVSAINEAISLRECGVKDPILVLGFTPLDFADKLVQYGITQTVYCPDYARSLSRALTALGASVKVHIKVDSGMGRLGFFGTDSAAEIAAVAALSGLDIEGIFTHFTSADDFSPEGIAYTHAQYQRFMGVIAELEERGVHFSLRHCCNSAGTVFYPQCHLDLVRPGLILYGHWPCAGDKIQLRRAMKLKSVVSMVKTLPAGSFVSYGNTYQTKAPTQVATIAVGYADGYPRQLSNRGWVGIGGRRARIIGRVCMDQMMVDVTGLGVSPGQEVVLFGDESDGVTVEDVAALCSTINYELLCILGRRVQRLYYRQGKMVEVLDYLLESEH
ncbi:alanine racemase [Neobittarella massiliensis]|uniref:alanine racemase n=1 Tax=Neobittarella massiliensis (ex Bilen et al. 2018) TaxID=2041842 RepID=UPI000CF64D06|nr:alanine racemase [Neobittarella massiliensis]